MSRWLDPEALARAWHWSEDAPVHRLSIDDPGLPTDELVACGQWVHMTVQVPGVGFQELDCEDPLAFLAFDPHSEFGRLYLILPEENCAILRDAFWNDDEDGVDLADFARSVGGHQQGDYPELDVQPIGPIIVVQYACRKYGHGQGADDGAIFDHELENVKPWLVIAEDGRLFIAGGSYIGHDLRGIVG